MWSHYGPLGIVSRLRRTNPSCSCYLHCRRNHCSLRLQIPHRRRHRHPRSFPMMKGRRHNPAHRPRAPHHSLAHHHHRRHPRNFRCRFPTSLPAPLQSLEHWKDRPLLHSLRRYCFPRRSLLHCCSLHHRHHCAIHFAASQNSPWAVRIQHQSYSLRQRRRIPRPLPRQTGHWTVRPIPECPWTCAWPFALVPNRIARTWFAACGSIPLLDRQIDPSCWQHYLPHLVQPS
mmetsp:Transcript_27360/g.75435  ORF Transcript_27360/g.75435 Transcript_27360/m.75435 type:complete len:230 (-) Transcript_27360:201-890(-)